MHHKGMVSSTPAWLPKAPQLTNTALLELYTETAACQPITKDLHQVNTLELDSIPR